MAYQWFAQETALCARFEQLPLQSALRKLCLERLFTTNPYQRCTMRVMSKRPKQAKQTLVLAQGRLLLELQESSHAKDITKVEPSTLEKRAAAWSGFTLLRGTKTARRV